MRAASVAPHNPGMQPSEPIRILLDPPVSGAEHCFELCETRVDPVAGPNGIATVTDLGGGKYEIVLFHAITAGGVTTIEYTGDGSYVAFTSHPANVNADTMAAPPDILKVVDYINGAAISPWGVYSEDILQLAYSTQLEIHNKRYIGNHLMRCSVQLELS